MKTASFFSETPISEQENIALKPQVIPKTLVCTILHHCAGKKKCKRSNQRELSAASLAQINHGIICVCANMHCPETCSCRKWHHQKNKKKTKLTSNFVQIKGILRDSMKIPGNIRGQSSTRLDCFSTWPLISLKPDCVVNGSILNQSKAWSWYFPNQLSNIKLKITKQLVNFFHLPWLASCQGLHVSKAWKRLSLYCTIILLHFQA